jgi:hypothetical protein
MSSARVTGKLRKTLGFPLTMMPNFQPKSEACTTPQKARPYDREPDLKEPPGYTNLTTYENTHMHNNEKYQHSIRGPFTIEELDYSI